MQPCTLSRDIGIPRLARARFTTAFEEPAAPFGMAPASRSVADTVQRLRQQDELDLAACELSLIHDLRPVAPLRPSAKATLLFERVMVGTSVAIFLLIAGGTHGWLR